MNVFSYYYYYYYYREIQGNIDEVEQVIKKIEKEKKENGGAGDKLSSLMKSLMTGF